MFSPIHYKTATSLPRAGGSAWLRALIAAAATACAGVSSAAPAPPPIGPAAAPSVATIGRDAVTLQDLEDRTADKLKERRSELETEQRRLRIRFEREAQALRESELQAIVDERVLALEAAARKSTPAALKAAVKPAAVSDAAVHAFYDSQRGAFNQPYETIAPRIRDYLVRQSQDLAYRSYVDSLQAKYHAVISLEPLREAVAAVGPHRGPADAPVSIIEFSDFQCPYCGRFTPVLRSVMDRYPKQVALTFRHLPLASLHADAEHAARAAVCAQDQGKFWEMHDQLFSDQTGLSDAGLNDKARKIGLDMTAFGGCLTGDKAGRIVQADIQAADQLGLAGTPATFINGRFVNGAVQAGELTRIIEDELRRSGTMARH